MARPDVAATPKIQRTTVMGCYLCVPVARANGRSEAGRESLIDVKREGGIAQPIPFELVAKAPDHSTAPSFFPFTSSAPSSDSCIASIRLRRRHFIHLS